MTSPSPPISPSPATSDADDLNALALPELYACLRGTGLIRRVLELARDEDLGTAGDLTARVCVEPSRHAMATLDAREAGVVAGLACIPDLLSVFAASCRVSEVAADGETIEPGRSLATFQGPARELLAMERTMLNLIGRLSGIATRTRQFVQAMRAGGPVRAELLDTRKTAPGLRVLEKYAVRCGGARCHRLGLHDAVLIKDNHLAGISLDTLGPLITRASRAARQERLTDATTALPPNASPRFVEVEVTSLEQLDVLLALPAGTVDIVLLDNMDQDAMREAVCRRDARKSLIQLEASGGVRLESVRAIALTGVERISAGTLTHGARALDVALEFR
ncbi:MAG: carboxylating nicotinate-nucleotide diphosphorylase [Planctomycetota bacterium]|nr:carboxylating nicotinate-nucleotide diphosphorylase [Planctomycetota bacterium]